MIGRLYVEPVPASFMAIKKPFIVEDPELKEPTAVTTSAPPEMQPLRPPREFWHQQLGTLRGRD
ncbi:hypothetical protein ABIC83_002418 [Roseateles asaccharophilus]|uniref:hypothetical protein n=1 Tax=Roseateles asaccharophilus TaxID=582607 RepID=UPI0038346397